MRLSKPGRVCFLLILGLLLSPTVLLADPPVAKTKWLINYQQAQIAAKRTHKPILAYFSGSDWDPWTQKLDQEVLETDVFRHWAAEKVILFRADMPHDKPLSSLLASQNQRLRTKFNVTEVPAFDFLDPSGFVFARGGYDDLRLRDDERTGSPKSAIAFLDHILATRPPDQQIAAQKSLDEGISYAKKHFISLLILIHQGDAPVPTRTRAELLANQQFVRYVNDTLAFVDLTWPDDTDTSAAADELRAFLTKNKVRPSPLQLLVWDMQTAKVKGRIGAIVPEDVDPLIATIQNQLPRLDAPSGWIEDLRLAQTVAAQQNRYILMAFTSMDGSDWCQKMQKEIFDTDEFTKYARKKLVLLRIDFPTATTQPTALKSQNQMLAEQYDVRGYPWVVILNPLGQKVGETKYQKGGPGPLLDEMDKVVQKDTERRAMLNNQDSLEQ